MNVFLPRLHIISPPTHRHGRQASVAANRMVFLAPPPVVFSTFRNVLRRYRGALFAWTCLRRTGDCLRNRPACSHPARRKQIIFACDQPAAHATWPTDLLSHPQDYLSWSLGTFCDQILRMKINKTCCFFFAFKNVKLLLIDYQSIYP